MTLEFKRFKSAMPVYPIEKNKYKIIGFDMILVNSNGIMLITLK